MYLAYIDVDKMGLLASLYTQWHRLNEAINYVKRRIDGLGLTDGLTVNPEELPVRVIHSQFYIKNKFDGYATMIQYSKKRKKKQNF